MKNINKLIIAVAVILSMAVMVLLLIEKGNKDSRSTPPTKLQSAELSSNEDLTTDNDIAITQPVSTEIETSIYDEEAIEAKIQELRAMFTDGKYWNHEEGRKYDVYTVRDIPCNHKANGEGTCNVYASVSNTMYPYKVRGSQCLGFASLCSDYVFGKDAAISKHTDYDKVRVGDQVRLNNDTHSVFVIEKTDEYIVVAECNADYKTCKLSWDRKIFKKDLKKAWYITRYID